MRSTGFDDLRGEHRAERVSGGHRAVHEVGLVSNACHVDGAVVALAGYILLLEQGPTKKPPPTQLLVPVVSFFCIYGDTLDGTNP